MHSSHSTLTMFHPQEPISIRAQLELRQYQPCVHSSSPRSFSNNFRRSVLPDTSPSEISKLRYVVRSLTSSNKKSTSLSKLYCTQWSRISAKLQFHIVQCCHSVVKIGNQPQNIASYLVGHQECTSSCSSKQTSTSLCIIPLVFVQTVLFVKGAKS